MLYVLSYQVFLNRRELFSPWKGLCQSSFFIYAHWVIRRPHSSCTNWKLVEKVYNNKYKNSILVLFLFFFPDNNFNTEVSIICFTGEKILQCSVQKQKHPRANFQILSPYSSATRTVDCLEICILFVSLLELLCDSSSKAEATTSNQRLI